MMDEDETDPTLYERHFLDGEYANWKMSTKYANVNPKTHLCISVAILFGILAMMLALAQLDMCYLYPYTILSSACDFGSSIFVISDKMKLSKENCDTIYEKEDWQKVPSIFYPDAIKDRKYTVFVLDPDAPDHPNGTYYLHMLQANVKCEDLKEGNFKRSMTLVPYVGPAPTEGTGFHRIMFVIYEHCRTFDEVPSMTISSRNKFDLKKWFKSIPINMIGPVVGVQFRVEHSS